MKNKALFAVLAAGTFWGTMGFFARSLYAAGFGPLEVAQTRITTGLLLVGLYILLFNRSQFKVKLKDKPDVAPAWYKRDDVTVLSRQRTDD